MAKRIVTRWRLKVKVEVQMGEVPESASEAPRQAGKKEAKEPEPSRQTLAVVEMDRDLGRFLDAHYRFRYNVLTGGTEVCPAGAGDEAFRAATARRLNAICIEAHAAGVPCWDRDLLRFVNSSRVPDFHPFKDYFAHLPEWDGMDRVEALARRVSDDEVWRMGFRRWLLGMAAQWMGQESRYANSVAPILVSGRQGMGKSTFCRALMPPSLCGYYSDSIDLGAQGGTERKLVELGLLNLDEFDRISSRRQPLLKNVMQLTSFTLRRAYRQHAVMLPRLASFIGTSNTRELLTDPSGSRRFLCVEVERPIDSAGIEHDQLYAQLKALLASGERHWFSAEEEEEVQRHNAAFYRVCPAEEAFHVCFRAAAPDEEAQLLSLPEIVSHVRRRFRGVMAGVNMQLFAHALVLAGVERRHTRVGNRYRVVAREKV